MSKEKKHALSKAKGLIPELRFPEFGKWVENTLGDLVKIRSGYSPSKYNLKTTGEHPFVKVEDLNNCDKYQVKSREYSNDNVNIIPKESVIFPKRGAAIELNKVRVNQVDILMDTNLMAITPNNKIKVEFLYYIILKVGLHKIADTSTIPQINNKHIEPYVINVPKPQEQQKIASCLSSLDELIAAHNDKLEALKDHKKGLMQNLFPQLSELGLDRLKDDRIKSDEEILKSSHPKNPNSDNVPKYRFPEFEEDGDWVEKKLGEICSMQAGKFVSASEIKEKLVPSLFPCYGGNGLRGYTKSFTHSGKFSLIGRQGALCGNITLADGQFHATEHAVVTTPKKNTDTLWLYYELELLNLNQYATGQAQPGLSVGNLVRLKLNIPNPKEQQKIASCLSSLDELITAQAEKIEQLQLHKKGLMQGLFPKITD